MLSTEAELFGLVFTARSYKSVVVCLVIGGPIHVPDMW